ncbi:DUF5658 family protein [Fictibacillus aquaticus]|uniref:DUF5658 domain-containing protein n=1 Tax=Fictibacillus aquaticus TaxID=2021314 RepID=A0A235FEF6_9BACL|nr:DUF5658 family protein [Fictibacillus aquaticus]OYD59738.1 hypothetical protein CGZ90_07615 [Fictibacillus aquaticus]
MELKAVSSRHLWICIFLAFFNVADALFTHYFLQNGGVELNPLMRTIYEMHPLLFITIKFLFSLLVLAIGLIPLRRKIQRLIAFAFSVYFVIISWQLFLLITHVKTG